ncbi:transmembrane amino acid transporter protein [Oesophagostomum dentatum]|uniref:Transmembrane amino acid transporter protein n=1 Tax=Oesophagostomum dentatum TaxID=61180 RepID=A0A0B1TSA9_OESDE|nr:transmembrane amino acid transporter protein [Oesophagostomum dentatum]
MTFTAGVVDIDQRLPENFEVSENGQVPADGPPAKSEKVKKISTTFALVNIIKGMIGTGCFAVPLAFKQAGLWTAFGIDFLLGFISIISMIKLVATAQHLCKKTKCGTLDYGELAREAFASCKPLARYKYVARWYVNCCLIFLQCGICSVYYIFVVEHAKEILSYFSLLGNVLMTASIAIILGELVMSQHIPTNQLPAFTDFGGAVLAAGSLMYALEGQAMVLPIENKMKHPEDMKGFNGVLSTGVSLVTIIYAACGFYGYITYGNNVEATITLNLSNSPLNLSVKIMLLCVVYTSFLIQQYPLVELLWPLAKKTLEARNTRGAYVVALEYCFRFSIVFVALGLSWLIPNLEEIIPLVGVSTGMLLALVNPSIIETR